MADRLYLSPEDRDLLVGLLRESRQVSSTTRQRARPDSTLTPAPELYVARIPAGGIPRRVGLTPSSADCLVYEMVPAFSRLPGGGQVQVGHQLRPVHGLVKKVYNLGLLPLVEFAQVPVTRDKFGTWWTICSPCLYQPITPETGTGTPGTGTGTEGDETGTGTADDIPDIWDCCSVGEPITGTGTGLGETTPIVTSWPPALQLRIVAIRPGNCFYLTPDIDLSCSVGAVIPMPLVADPIFGLPGRCYHGRFERAVVPHPPPINDLYDYTGFGPFVDCIHIILGTIDDGLSSGGPFQDTFVGATLCCSFGTFPQPATSFSFAISGNVYGLQGGIQVAWENGDGVEHVEDNITYLFNACETFANRPVYKEFTGRFAVFFGPTCIWAEIDFVLEEP